ncbi:MAG: STAS domain-containing protein [Fibrobacterota bacterium]
MEIKKQAFGEYSIYRLKGSLDHQSVDFVMSEITESRGHKVVIDINEVSHIDSTGFGVLIKLWKSVTYQDGELHLLCRQSGFLNKLYELNLHKIIHIFSDESVFQGLKEETNDPLATVTVSKVEHFKVITFSQPLENLVAVRQFSDYLHSQVETGSIFLALDFSKIKCIYSDMISILLALRRQIALKDGWLVFIGVREELYGLFECVGVTQMFDMYPDEKAFLAALKGKNIIKGLPK